MSQNSRKALIPDRVMIVGEEGIPRDILEAIEDHHLQIFLREPDPAQWPPEIRHLVAYLPQEERIRWQVANVIAGHGNLIGDSLEQWARAVWSELIEKEEVSSVGLDLILSEMGKYLERQVVQYLDLPPETPPPKPDP
ncbi:MAG: hypothetical protein P8182_09495 [Deltaproteobacteria bacterium]